MIRLMLLAVVTVCCSACSDYYTEGDYLFVRSDGADMPVWIAGDQGSDTLILFLHGGPGGDASTASLFPAFDDLETRYRVAYWDQRASGLSQGNPSVDTYTVPKFVEDTDLVVDVLRQRYSPERLFIFGHSWGGALGVAYLSDTDRQTKVDGFIMEDAGYNLIDGLPASGRWMREFAQKQIDAGADAAKWTDIRDWLDTDPDFTNVDNYRRLADSYIVSGGRDAYYHDPDNKGVGPDGQFVFNSFASLALLTGGGSIRKNFDILELDLTPELGNITLPTLVIWGRHDGVNTVEMGEAAFEGLGSPDADKHLVVFEQSGHQPFIEEPDLFLESFHAFVDRN